MSKELKRHDMIKILRKNGWWIERNKGPHTVYTNDEGKRLLLSKSNPNPNLFRKHIKENNMLV